MPRRPLYDAPYLFADGQHLLPEGDFLLPICTTRERFVLMSNALIKGGLEMGLRRLDDHNVDFVDALAYLDQPLKNRCISTLLDKCYEYPGSSGGGGLELPDCITITEVNGAYQIDICEDQCDMPIYVNIYDGCGCGCGGGCDCGGGVKKPPPPSPGAKDDNPGNPYEKPPDTKRITPCDAVTNVAPYILGQGYEFFRAIRQLVDAGTSAPEALAEAISTFYPGASIPSGFSDWADELSEIGFQAIENLMTDTDFKLRYQTAFFQEFGADRTLTEIARPRLRNVTGALPLFWGNPISTGGIIPLPRLIFSGFHRIINLDKVNLQLQLSKSKGDSALCEYLYGETGITPPDVPTQKPPPSEQIFTYGSENRTAYVIKVDTIPSSQTDFIEMHSIIGDVVGLATLGWYGINAGGALQVRLQIKDDTNTTIYDQKYGYCCTGQVVEWYESGNNDANTQAVLDALYAQIGSQATARNTSAGGAPTTESIGDTIGGAGTVNNGDVYYDTLIVIYDTSSLQV